MLWMMLALACGPTQEMGAACESSEQCVEGGACLKGVCAGYGCTQADDCSNDHECAVIAEVQVCAMRCAVDSDCPGELGCDAVGEGGETYCL